MKHRLNKNKGSLIISRDGITAIIKCGDLTDEYLDEFYGVETGIGYNVSEVDNAINAVKNLVGKEERLTMLLSIKEPAPMLIFPTRALPDDPCMTIAPVVDKSSSWWKERHE